MNSRHLVDRFAAARDAGEPVVLVTVYETQGSTYSKAGTRMLILPDGRHEGLVSGGCLEGDLAARARQVLAADAAATVTYDMRDEADELYGLGIGCNGLISVLLEPVTAGRGYEPLASIAEALLGDEVGAIATVVAAGPDDAAAPGAAALGASAVIVGGDTRVFALPEGVVGQVRPHCEKTRGSRAAALVALPAGPTVLCAPLVPIPRVLVLGAGLDAVPLVNIVAELGWRVTVADHRPAYLARRDIGRAEALVAVEPTALRESLEPERFDAIVIMSHHLNTDREYLRQLAGAHVPYLGLLGPPARRRRLLDELGAAGAALAARLRGPVGIDIGADSAESIAVSIAAEMQSVLVRAV